MNKIKSNLSNNLKDMKEEKFKITNEISNLLAKLKY